MIYFDSETIGFTGPMVLLQYAEDDGPIHLHDVWHEPIEHTLEVIHKLVESDVCAFNMVFDWFHINKLYNVLRVFYDGGYKGIPTVRTFADVDAQNPSKYCLKPKSALDPMLIARHDKFQHTMRRKDITLKRIPRQAAELVAAHLENSIDIPDICFANSTEGYKWRMRDLTQDTVNPSEDVVDLYLRFSPAGSLGALCHHILGEDKADWPIPKSIKPTEKSWHPYGEHGDKPWTLVADQWIQMWQMPQARYYGEKDVHLLRRLHKEVFPEYTGGDTDSELACAVSAARWRGFEIDHNRVADMIPEYQKQSEIAPTAPKQALIYLQQVLQGPEKLVVTSTDNATLESLIRSGSTEDVRERASKIAQARQAKNRLGLFSRLLEVPRFHPEFKIIGTKSNRQSGGSEDKSKGSINPQGIPGDFEIRKCFPFARPEEEMWGGDAKACQVTIIDAVLPDKKMHEELMSGKSFHALMGQIWYDAPYEEMIAAKESKDDDRYDRVKAADFALVFGANAPKLAQVLDLAEDEGETLFKRGHEMYPEMFAKREEIAMRFCSMRQPKGIGTNVEWHEPAEYIDSLFGFKRYFTIENSICKALFDLANKVPKEIESELKDVKVVRHLHRGAQTGRGALMSACFAAAFNIQAQNMRAACNHIIQSPEGYIAKEFQRTLWDEQPKGVNPWTIRTFNMHDELIAVTNGRVNTTEIRDEVMERFKQQIPLLAWEWDQKNSWAKDDNV